MLPYTCHTDPADYTDPAGRFLTIGKLPDLASMLGIDPAYLLHIALSPEYRSFNIPKSLGGYRQINSPGRVHMIIQKKLNAFLQPVYASIKPRQVHGFVRKDGYWGPAFNTRSNASVHIGQDYVINTDLKDFFHSITAGRVRDMFIAGPFHFTRDIASLLAVLTTWYNRLPMGAPTSPVISNLVMRDLDARLVSLAGRYLYMYSRYADDLTFSGNARPGETFFPELQDCIESEGFEVNKRKVRIQSRLSRQVVTGIVVNEKQNLPRKYYRHLRAVLHDWEMNGIEVAVMRYFRLEQPPGKRMLRRFTQSITSMIQYLEYVRGTDDPLANRLREKMRGNLYRFFN